jgi:hypothetical protein
MVQSDLEARFFALVFGQFIQGEAYTAMIGAAPRQSNQHTGCHRPPMLMPRLVDYVAQIGAPAPAPATGSGRNQQN